jgi:hypothetical protein
MRWLRGFFHQRCEGCHRVGQQLVFFSREAVAFR